MELQEWEIELQLQAPLKSGEYVIQFDIVHEGVTWYSQQGNTFPELSIQVVPSGI